MALEFGFIMALIGVAVVFSSLALIAGLSVVLKRLFKEKPKEGAPETPALHEEPKAETTSESNTYKISVDGKTHEVKIRGSASAGTVATEVAVPSGLGEEVKVVVDGEEFAVKIRGGFTRTTPTSDRVTTVTSAQLGGKVVKAPMQGSVVKVLVKVGDRIEKGSAVLVLETMKMENAVESPFSGTVKSVRVSVGSAVKADDVLMVIE